MGTEVQPLRQATTVHWAMYLLLCALTGLCWLPVVITIGVEGGIASGPVLRQTLLWLVLSGLAVGIPYRILKVRQSGPPAWFPVLLPAIAVTIRCLTPLLLGMRTNYEMIVDEFLTGIVQGYLCMGIALIPFAYGHIAALRWLDAQLSRWTPRLTVRGLRHVAYGGACLAILGITEIPRLFEVNRKTVLDLVEKKLEMELPSKAEVIYQEFTEDYKTLDFQNGFGDEGMMRGGAKVWVRSEYPVPLPNNLQANVSFFEPTDFEGRLSAYIDIDTDFTEVVAYEWKKNGFSTRVSIFRTEKADYVRYEKWKL